MLVLNGAIAFGLWRERQDQLDEAQRNAERLATLLAEHTSKAVQTADLVLQSIKNRLERAPAVSDNDESLREEIKAWLTELPHVRALFVANADGTIVYTTDSSSTPDTELAGRDYFLSHKEGSISGIDVGRPVRSRAVESWFVPVSRRIERGGVFVGVAVAAIEPRFFEDLYRALKLGGDDSVALFDTDATLVARVPDAPEFIGKVWPDLELFKDHLPRAPVGTFRGESFTNEPAVISYHQLGTLPLVTSIALNERQVLARWRGAALAWGLAALTATTLLLAAPVAVEWYRRRARMAARRALRAQKLEALGQMTGTIVHDFNNVLSVAGASLRLIRRQGPNERYVTAGEEALQRGARLTSQLLSFAKREEMRPTLVDANELLRSLQPVIRQAAGRKVKVSYQLDSNILPCFADRAQFDAAVINLVINGVQAMQGGELTIATEQVTLRPGQPFRLPSSRYVAVRVKDTGCGIPESDLHRVFEPFYTTKSEAGTGLGLAQVQAFMREIGGAVRIESKVGVGTTVELLFRCSERASHHRLAAGEDMPLRRRDL